MKINPNAVFLWAGLGLLAGALGGTNSGLAMAGAAMVASGLPGAWSNLLFWSVGVVAAYMVRV